MNSSQLKSNQVNSTQPNEATPNETTRNKTEQLKNEMKRSIVPNSIESWKPKIKKIIDTNSVAKNSFLASLQFFTYLIQP